MGLCLHTAGQVIYVNEKKGWAQDRALWDSRLHRGILWSGSLHHHRLLSLREEVLNPGASKSPDSVALQLVDKQPMADLVEGLGEIKHDSVNLASPLQGLSSLIHVA